MFRSFIIFYGVRRSKVKRKFAFNFEFFLDCFYTWMKGKFFNNRINRVSP